MRRIFVFFVVGVISSMAAWAQGGETPSPALLVLNKADTSLAIVDPATLKVVGRVFAGQDPHEVIASADGKLAFVSNYGGFGEGFHTLSVIDLVNQKPLPPIDLSPLRSPHGLAQAQGKIYFTAEANKVIGRYDPATQKIDWILGLGQNRTHMIVVTPDAKRIVTSNVNSDTISLIEHATGPVGGPGFGRGPGRPSSRPDDFGGPGGFPPGDPNGGPPGDPNGGPNGGPPGGPNGGPPGGDPNGGPPDPNGPPPGPPPDFGGGGGGGGDNRRGNPPPFPPGGPGHGPNEWNVIDVPVGKGPEGFDLSPDGKEVWAANSHDGTISVVNVDKKTVDATLHVPTRMANRLKFTPDGKLVFVSDLGGSGVVIIDVATRKEVQRIKIGRGSAGILMQPNGARAYVASGNGVSVIDLKTLTVVGHVETGRGPDGLGWAVRP